MSSQNQIRKPRTRIENLSTKKLELSELSKEEQQLILGGIIHITAGTCGSDGGVDDGD
jgi:hypothetical protein